MFVCPVCRTVLEDEGHCVHDEVEGVALDSQPIPTEIAAKFRVQGLVGGGDTGTLYRVEHAKSGAPGVLKLLRLSPKLQRAGRERLLTELRRQVSVGSKAHLSIPRAVGDDGGLLWVFRQWIDGESLKARLFRRGPLSVGEAIGVIAQVANALDELHRAGLVHNAVRPGHIILRDTGEDVPEAVLIDSGMAGSHDRFSAFEDLGDLLYMPPEVTQGKAPTFRSDLYALGCTFFDALTGEPPFDGDDAETVIAAHRFTLPSIPDALPTAVGEVLSKLLAKVPSQRATATSEIKTALRPFLPDEPRSMPRKSSMPPRKSSMPPRKSSMPPRKAAQPSVASRPSSMPPPLRPRSESRRPAADPSHRPEPAGAKNDSAPAPAKNPMPVAMPAPVARLGKKRPDTAPIALVTRKRVDPGAVPGTEPLPAREPSQRSEIPTAAEEAAPSFASPPKRRDATSSIRFAIADMTEAAERAVVKKGRRIPWLAAGFVLGCLSTAAATYGLAMNGQFHVLTGAMQDYLQVPSENLADRTSVASECGAAEEPLAAEASDSESTEAESEPGTALGADEEAASNEAPTDEATSDEAASNEAASDEAASNEAASNEAASNEAASNEAVSNEAASEEASPDGASADGALPEEQTTSEGADSEEGGMEADPATNEADTEGAARAVSEATAMEEGATPEAPTMLSRAEQRAALRAERRRARIERRRQARVRAQRAARREARRERGARGARMASPMRDPLDLAF
ncbi:MAG: protein kinase [Myxococcota bacterium]